LFLFYKNIFGYMGIPIPTIVEKIAEKKMIVMMTFYFIFQ
jgi:hypothetical protein